MKGKKESAKRVINEIQARKLSEIDFEIVVIRMLNKLSEKYKQLQGTYKELTGNYNSMKKDTETINKNQEEMKNTISEMKNTVQGIKSRLDEAEDQISN